MTAQPCPQSSPDVHVDIVSTQPLVAGGAPKLLKRTTEDDPTIGAQVRSGWATYVHMSEPHTMADCPFPNDGWRDPTNEATARSVIERWKEHATQLEAERDRYREALERIAGGGRFSSRMDEAFPSQIAQEALHD